MFGVPVYQVPALFQADSPPRGPGYSLTFHTYKKAASLAVSTLRPAFRVARFRAERTFSLESANSASGTLIAEPAFNPSRSLRIVVTICLCFPFRPCGTSACTIVLKCIGAVFVRLRPILSSLTISRHTNDTLSYPSVASPASNKNGRQGGRVDATRSARARVKPSRAVCSRLKIQFQFQER